MHRHFWFLLAIVALAGNSVAAQKAAKVPKRPKLAQYADTNDAQAYWRYGQSKLVDDPWEAGDAFYWSIQINPTWADGYYGRWVARWLEDPVKLIAVNAGETNAAEDAEAKQIDSLRLRAFSLNPFLYERLRKVMWEQLIARQFEGTQRGEIEIALARSWRNNPYSRAVAAYTIGNFPLALAGYDTTITEIEKDNKEHPGKAKERNKQDAEAANTVASLHAARGRMFYISGNFDSAYAELVKAQGGREVADEKRVVRVYESKAILDQSIGLTFERLHMPDSAREAYGRALLEDLGYAPAHLSLASLALSDGDTTQALSELETAAQMSPNDPATAFFYGRALIAAAKDKEGMEQLKHCASLDPYFAAPHMLLGMLYESSDYNEEAAMEFKLFLSLAAANDPYREQVKEKLGALPAGSAGKP